MTHDFHAADVWSLLTHWAEVTPEAPAFLHGDRALSFAELHEQALRAAQGLADLGVGPGDRVALWLPNMPAYPILYFACVRLGAIAVAVNTRYRAVEVADIVGRSGAKLLACAPGFRRMDFLSILAEVEPAALDRLAAIVTVGEVPAAAPPAIERLRPHVCPPARCDAGPLAVSLDQVGGLRQLQRRARHDCRARAAAWAAAVRPLRHERGPGALCAPAARRAGCPA